MDVRLVRAWGGFDAGKVFESVPEGQAKAMIEYGYAEQITVQLAEPDKNQHGQTRLGK